MHSATTNNDDIFTFHNWKCEKNNQLYWKEITFFALVVSTLLFNFHCIFPSQLIIMKHKLEIM
jgi:hypothetical protein